LIKIYPNPTQGIIRIDGKIDNVAVYDLLGKRMIYEENPGPATELDLGTLKEGVYIIRVYVEGYYITEKVLKRR
jgi:hypothetical protein